MTRSACDALAARPRSILIGLMALIAVTVAISISPAQSQSQTGQVVALVGGFHRISANTSVFERGVPAENPHYYTAGTDYEFFSELRVVASDVSDTSDLDRLDRLDYSASPQARYNSGWSKYNINVQQWNPTGMSWGTPATGVAIATSTAGVSCPGTAPSCDVAQAALRTGQSEALGDLVAYPVWRLITPSTLTATLRIVATTYSIVAGVETAGLTDSFELRVDAGPKPKLFFFSGNTPARPCTDAEIAAEAQDACDPANIAVDDPVIIGFTVLNGNEDQSQITTNAGQRTRLRSFRDFHRIEFSSDGPGAFRLLHSQPCHAGLNTCTAFSAGWQSGHGGASNYGSYAVGEAGTLDAAVGATAVAFYPLAGQARDYTITANLHLTQSGNAVATHQITVEDLHGRAAARLTGITVQGLSDGGGALRLAPLFNLPAWDSETKAPATDGSILGRGSRPILFDELGADGLTVSVDKGSFTLQGSVSLKGSDCTPTDDGCTWSRTKTQLLAEQGLQGASDAGLRSIGIFASAPWYFRAPLDDEGPATITASFHTADGNTQEETATIPYFRVTKPTFEVRLAGGDDAELKPGSTAEVEIGFRFRADSSPFRNQRFPILVTESGHGEVDAPLDSRLSRIEISGPAVWDDTGGRLYSLTPTGVIWECARTVAGTRFDEYFCRIGKSSGATARHESPRVRVDEGAVGAVAVSAVVRAPSARLETFGNSFFIAHQRSSGGTWSTRAFHDARYDIGPVHSASASWEVGGSGMAPDDIAVYLDTELEGQGRGYYRPDARTEVRANPDDPNSVSHIGHFVYLSLQRSDVALEDRGHNCPWDSDDECERARFNDPWHRVDLRLEVRNDSSGSFSAVDSSTHHIYRNWASAGACDDPVGDALCTITKDEWRTLSRTTAGDASVPSINFIRVLLPLGEQRNHRVVADLYALRTPGDASTAYKVDSHSIPLIPDRTPTVKLFFYKVEGGQTRPCTDAEMAAERGDDCDPVISDGRPIHIGFTVLNGPGDHTVTGLGDRRWVQAPYHQSGRLNFSLNGPGLLDGIEIGTCNNSAADVGVNGGTCTIWGYDWLERQSEGVVGAFDRAPRGWSDVVGHAALAFAPLPTSDPRDFTITAEAQTWDSDRAEYVTESTSTLSVEGALAQPGTPQVTTDGWGESTASSELPELRAPRKPLRSLPGTAVEGPVHADDAGIVLAGQLPASGTAVKHVIADGRILAYLYGDSQAWTWCSPDPAGGCALEITRSQLFSTNFADSAPVNLRSLLIYPTVGTSGPARITSTVTTADGSTTPPTVHEIPHERISEPVFEVRFPDDADGILEPGQEAQVQAGWLFTIDRPQTKGFRMGTWLGIGSQYRDTEDQMIYTDRGSTRTFIGNTLRAQTYFDETATRFTLAGDAVWESGEENLPRGAGGANYGVEVFTCDAEESQDNSSSTTFFCWHSSGPDKQLPLISIAEDASSDVKLHANFTISDAASRFGNWFRVDYQRDPPVGTTVSPETALAWRRFGDLPQELFGSFTIPVRVVEQLSTASVARAGDAAGAIRTGRSAGIELRVRNAEQAATSIDAVSSIVLQATAGALGGAYCGGGTTCTIDLAEGSAFRTAVAADPKLMGQIPITFTAPGKSGSASVSATVVGGGRAAGTVLSATPLAIEYTSEAVVLSLTANVPRVLAYDTPDEGADKNDDDVVEIAVSAMDDRGASTGVPPTATREIRDPDGEVVSQGIVVTLECPVAGGAGAGSGCKFVLDVDAAEENPLKAGLYTFTARLSSEASAMAEFAVAGRPASVAVSAGDVPNIGQTMSVEIAVADEDGQPVADGTKVRVSVAGRGGASTPLVLVDPANGEAETANGRATARFAVTGNEVAVVRVSAGGTAAQPDAATVAVVDARRAAAPEDAAASAPAAGLSTSSMSEDGELETPTDTLSFWRSSTPTTASELLADLPDARAVWLWNGYRWIRYAEQDGAAVPGSIDFPLHREDLLWIEGG